MIFPEIHLSIFGRQTYFINVHGVISFFDGQIFGGQNWGK